MDVRCEPTCRELDEMLESIKTLVASGACDRPVDDIRHRYISPVHTGTPLAAATPTHTQQFATFRFLKSITSVFFVCPFRIGSYWTRIAVHADYRREAVAGQRQGSRQRRNRPRRRVPAGKTHHHRAIGIRGA